MMIRKRTAAVSAALLMSTGAVASELSVFRYDALGRLVIASHRVTNGTGGSSEYRYDPASNRQTVRSAVVRMLTWMPSNTSLSRGESIISEGGGYEFVFGHDGNVVLRDSSNQTRWSTNTANTTANMLSMQSDGNLVLYGPSGPIFATNTAGNPGAQLAVQCDGNLVIYRANSTAAWASNTSTGC